MKGEKGNKGGKNGVKTKAGYEERNKLGMRRFILCIHLNTLSCKSIIFSSSHVKLHSCVLGCNFSQK